MCVRVCVLIDDYFGSFAVYYMTAKRVLRCTYEYDGNRTLRIHNNMFAATAPTFVGTSCLVKINRYRCFSTRVCVDRVEGRSACCKQWIEISIFALLAPFSQSAHTTRIEML